MRRSGLAFLMLLWPALALAQGGEGEPLTLSDALALARLHSPAYRRALNDFHGTGTEPFQAWGRFLPQIGFSGGLTHTAFSLSTFTQPDGTVADLRAGPIPVVVEGDTLLADRLDSFRRFSQGGVNLQLTLLDGGRNVFGIGRAAAIRRAADRQVSAQALETELAVARAFFEVLKAQRLLEYHQQELRRRTERRTLAEARYEVGVVTQADVLEARLNVGQQDVEVLNAENQRAQAQFQLNEAMGVALDRAYRLVGKFPIFEPQLEVESLVSGALRGHPSVERLEAQAQVARQDLRMANAFYLPTVNLGASFSRSDFCSGDLEARGTILREQECDFTLNPFNRSESYNLSISWDLFDRFDRLHRSRQAEVSLENAREVLRETRLQQERQVREASLNLRRAYLVYRTNQVNVELAERELELAQQQYQLGSSSFLDLLDSQVLAARAHTDLIEAQYDFHIALAELEAATGQRLRPEGTP